MSTYTVGTVVTSTAVASVNQTGEAMFGRPFVVRRQEGWEVQNVTTVLTSTGTVMVNTVSYTTIRPNL